MRKELYFLIILVIAFGVFSLGGKHKQSLLEDASGTDYLSVTSTNSDTSEVLNNVKRAITFGYTRYDTLAGASTNDSIAFKLYVQSWVGTFFDTARWKTEDSLSVAGGDSTFDRWIFTDRPRSNSKRYRVIMTGVDSNRVDSEIRCAIIPHIYED